MKHSFRKFFLTVVSLALFSGIGNLATAQSVDVGVSGTGAVKLGAAAVTCNAAMEGAVRYVDASNRIELCDDTVWRAIGGDDLGNHTATTNLNMSNNKITSLATPTAASDAATKAYVDAAMVTPSSWSCTQYQKGGSGYQVRSCTGSQKLITWACDCATSTAILHSRIVGQGAGCYCSTGNVTTYVNCCS